MAIFQDSESKAVAIVILIAAIAIAFYAGAAYVFDWGLSEKPSSWGPFGDYVGGIINPAIALAALYVLVKVSKNQKNEFKATRNHLKTEAKKNEIYRVISHLDRKLELMLAIDVHKKGRRPGPFDRGGILRMGGISDEEWVLGPLNDYLIQSWRRRGEVYVLLGDSESKTPLADYLPQIRANIERLEKYISDYKSIKGEENAAVSSYFEDIYAPLKAACIETEEALVKEAKIREKTEEEKAETHAKYDAAATPEEAPDDGEFKPED